MLKTAFPHTFSEKSNSQQFLKHSVCALQIALKQNDRVECYVDEVGHYTRQMGYALEGRDVLGDGAEAALNLLKKHVVYQHDCVHSYPYDWRTKRVGFKYRLLIYLFLFRS